MSTYDYTYLSCVLLSLHVLLQLQLQSNSCVCLFSYSPLATSTMLTSFPPRFGRLTMASDVHQQYRNTNEATTTGTRSDNGNGNCDTQTTTQHWNVERDWQQSFNSINNVDTSSIKSTANTSFPPSATGTRSGNGNRDTQITTHFYCKQELADDEERGRM